MRFEVSYTLEPLEKSTKFIWEMKAEQSAFFNPSDPVEARIYKRQVEAGIYNLKEFVGNSLHDTWIELLYDKEKEHHVMGFWNKALNVLSSNKEKEYLVQRYEQLGMAYMQ